MSSRLIKSRDLSKKISSQLYDNHLQELLIILKLLELESSKSLQLSDIGYKQITGYKDRFIDYIKIKSNNQNINSFSEACKIALENREEYQEGLKTLKGNIQDLLYMKKNKKFVTI